MRNALNTLAVLAGITLLIGTVIPAPAGAQDDTSDEGGETTSPEMDADAVETAPDPAAPETATSETEALDSETSDTEAAAPEAAAPEAAEEQSDAEQLSAPNSDADDAFDTAPEPFEDAALEEDATETESDEAPARAGPALTFANSFFSYTNQATLNTFAPGGQLTYNPTWTMFLSLTPRFYLTDTTFLWLNQGMSLELTDSDSGARNHDPLLTDTTLDLRHNIIWEGFLFQAQARLVFPLSKMSQAAQHILQTGLGLSVIRPFPELASFTVGASVGYRRWWSTSNVSHISGPGLDYSTRAGTGFCEDVSGGQRSPVCTNAGVQTTARDLLITSLFLTVMPLPGLTVQFSGAYLGMYGHEIMDAEIPINGDTVHLEGGGSTHWRHFTSFTLAVGYDVLPYLNLSIGVQNSGFAAPLFNPNGSVRSPFNPDTSAYLTATLGIDALVKEFEGSDEDQLTPEERQRRRQGLARQGSSSSF